MKIKMKAEFGIGDKVSFVKINNPPNEPTLKQPKEGIITGIHYHCHILGYCEESKSAKELTGHSMPRCRSECYNISYEINQEHVISEDDCFKTRAEAEARYLWYANILKD